MMVSVTSQESIEFMFRDKLINRCAGILGYKPGQKSSWGLWSDLWTRVKIDVVHQIDQDALTIHARLRLPDNSAITETHAIPFYVSKREQDATMRYAVEALVEGMAPRILMVMSWLKEADDGNDPGR